MTRITFMAVAFVVMAAFAVVKANPCSSGGECPSGRQPNNVVSMLQTNLLMNALQNNGDEEAAHSGACSNLLNKYTHFAVKVAVGTPPQSFELVADTGSDAAIVTSCICVDDGYCEGQKSCFRGHHKSSTFDIPTEDVAEIEMSFGSGKVVAVVATDFVDVGGVKARMQDGLMLMVDRRKLNVSLPFDGILGLGPPKTATQQQGLDEKTSFHVKRFLKEAGVQRFTICFNGNGEPGVLRMDPPQFQKTIPAIGTMHWAFGLHGVSVGSENAPAIVCNPSEATNGQQTPCGGIPDSGTTLLTAPKHHAHKLFTQLCEDWDRCRTARQGRLKNEPAANAFVLLLRECNEWMTDDPGIYEVPSIFFTVGDPSDPQKIELTPWAYVVEIDEASYDSEIKWSGIEGVTGRIKNDNEAKQLDKVCVPRIGADDFDTNMNGPVWLLGTPLFYEFTVGYDMQKPGISFKGGRCVDCKASVSLVDGTKQLSKRVRSATEPPRVRKFDKALPL